MKDILKQIKNEIAVIEASERNIEAFNRLKGREIALIPTDSIYYKEFEKWVRKEEIYYKGDGPIYISGEDVKCIINRLIMTQKEHSEPYLNKLEQYFNIKNLID